MLNNSLEKNISLLNLSTIEFTGYHGTNADNEESIIQNSFLKSNTREDWFGEGCYFFTQGISAVEPLRLAELWAIDQAWDKKIQAYKYDKYIVFKTIIECNSDFVLDLTVKDGLALFNIFREAVLDKIRKANKKLAKGDYADSDIFDEMKQNIDISVIIGNVFIKFADVRRVPSLRSNLPNVTMFCVNNTNTEYIETTKHQVIQKGEIQI